MPKGMVAIVQAIDTINTGHSDYPLLTADALG